MKKLEVGDKVKVSCTGTVISIKRNGAWLRLDIGVDTWMPFDTSKEVE